MALLEVIFVNFLFINRWLRCRVMICLLVLAAGRALNVFVPIQNKKIGKFAWNLSCLMLKNVYTARFLEYVWPFFNIMHEKVNLICSRCQYCSYISLHLIGLFVMRTVLQSAQQPWWFHKYFNVYNKFALHVIKSFFIQSGIKVESFRNFVS